LLWSRRWAAGQAMVLSSFRAANDGTIMNLSTYVLYVLTPLLESVLGRDRVVMLKYMYGSSSRYLGGKEHGSLRVVVGDACT